jgi:hypothetical protein
MTALPQPRSDSVRVARSPQSHRWLLFVHQLPTQPSSLRVVTWRRLQQLGAVPLKQAVYVLPDTPAAREDFEWLKTEVIDAGGDATVFSAANIDAWSDAALVDEFRRLRQEGYAQLAIDVEEALERAGRSKRPRGTRAPAIRRLLDIFRARLAAIEAIDFFGSAGRDRATAALDRLASRESSAKRRKTPVEARAAGDRTKYQGRVWITRPRPGVDRMSSAWLIRRFIDPRARFGFASDRQAGPDGSIPFDMFGVEFSHQGDGCTFETLCSVFGIHGSAISRIAAIVHDLDLKDERFGAPECPAVGAMIEGLRLTHEDDDVLLAQGMTFFESLFRSFDQAARSAGPRPVARPKPAKPAARSTKRK